MALYRNKPKRHIYEVTIRQGWISKGCMRWAWRSATYYNMAEDFYITCALGSSHLFHNEGNGHSRM